jgi:predicted O-methyltransferase YrrM
VGAAQAARVSLRRPPRAVRVLRRSFRLFLSVLPRGLKSSRQLAREAVAGGAVQKVGELAGLVRLVRELRPAVVLEIGSFRGGTFRLWSQLAAEDALVVGVDIDTGYGAAPTAVLESVARPGQHVVALRLDSQQEATRDEVERILDGRPVDFLFIDADHTYAGVRRDFELYAPLVRPGGLVAFHDVITHTGLEGIEVDRLWRQIRGEYESWEFLQPEHDIGFGPWGGIGVIRWNGRRR